jgi:hypothetical protein
LVIFNPSLKPTNPLAERKRPVAIFINRAASVMDPVLLIASKRAIFPGPIRPPVFKSMGIESWVVAMTLLMGLSRAGQINNGATRTAGRQAIFGP